VQICIHKVKDQVNIAVVLGSDHILQDDDVFVSRQLLKENNFSEGALGICCVLERIKILLKRYDSLGALVNGLPNNSVSTLSYMSSQSLSHFCAGWGVKFVW
jgi:hypothetical protein